MLLRSHLQTVHHRCTRQQAYSRTRCFLSMRTQFAVMCAMDRPSACSGMGTESAARNYRCMVPSKQTYVKDVPQDKLMVAMLR